MRTIRADRALDIISVVLCRGDLVFGIGVHMYRLYSVAGKRFRYLASCLYLGTPPEFFFWPVSESESLYRQSCC